MGSALGWEGTSRWGAEGGDDFVQFEDSIGLEFDCEKVCLCYAERVDLFYCVFPSCTFLTSSQPPCIVFSGPLEESSVRATFALNQEKVLDG